MVRRAKTWLREHRWFGRAYAQAASTWHRLRVAAYQFFCGRYHSASRFDRVFRGQFDPWNYNADSVAQARRDLLIAAVPAEAGRALEIGCAEGFITVQLARHCRELLAVDISAIAISRARLACLSLTNVQFEVLDLQCEPLPGVFDTILCAGVLVFLAAADQRRISTTITNALAEGGILILEHTQRAYPGEQAGRDIHALYRSQRSLRTLSHAEVENYAITVLEKSIT